MTIECVTIASAHRFDGNPIASQHRLRYKSLIERQSWDVPYFNNMEYDQYDNPATIYFVWRDKGEVKAVARLYPTIKPYMLKDVFPHLVSFTDLPSDQSVWEGSRFCIDKNLPVEQRSRVIKELVIAYIEYCLAHNISSIIGLMVPPYWKSVFINNGCEIEWLGETGLAGDGKKVRAGKLEINPELLENVKNITGISENVLCYGKQDTLLHAC